MFANSKGVCVTQLCMNTPTFLWISYPFHTKPTFRQDQAPECKIRHGTEPGYVQCHNNQDTHPFNGPFSGTTWVSRYQKGKTNLDFTGARASEWQWHQLGYLLVCTSLQTDNHASTRPPLFFTGRMPFLPPNQQRQSTEGLIIIKRTE